MGNDDAGRHALVSEADELLTSAPLRELAADDARFRAIVGVSFDAYYDWDIATGDNYFSEHFDDLLGQPAGSARRWFYAWLELLHDDDEDRVLRSLAAAFRRGSTWDDEYRLRRADGAYVWVRDTGVIARDQRGHPARMIGTIRDTTRERDARLALEQAAELHRTLFIGAANPAVRVNRDGRYLEANGAALSFWDRDAAHMGDSDFWRDFPEELHALVAKAFSSEERLEAEALLDVGGTARTVMVTIVPCRIGDEDSFFCLCTDITGHKLLEQRLQDSNTALRVVLEQLNDDKLELERRIAANLDLLITPALDQLQRQLRAEPEVEVVKALRDNLAEITRPFAARLSAPSQAGPALTRRELEVAGYIRVGKTTDQIAELLHISRSAVEFHRGNIRRKLGLKRGDPQLGTALTMLLSGASTA